MIVAISDSVQAIAISGSVSYLKFQKKSEIDDSLVLDWTYVFPDAQSYVNHPKHFNNVSGKVFWHSDSTGMLTPSRLGRRSHKLIMGTVWG